MNMKRMRGRNHRSGGGGGGGGGGGNAPQATPQLPPGSPFEEFFEEFFKNRRGQGDQQAPNRSPRRVSSPGSGFVIDSSGIVVTNNHVIDAAVGGGGSITVEFDNGDTLPATIVGRDSNYDLAVLKVNKGNLPVIQIGSSSSLNIGDQLIAFGSPLGLDHTVTSGIVSSLNRPVTTGTTGAESYVDAIQTDAAINPGNSGGPLTDGLGRMVGINSAIASLGASSPFGGSQAGSIGLGFAIPIDEAKRIFDEIIKNGYRLC